MTGSDTVQLLLLEQLPEIPVAKLSSSSLRAEVLAAGVGSDIATAAVQLELEAVRHLGDEVLVAIGFRRAQLVIEMDYREDNAEFLPHLEQDAQQRD